MEKEKAIELLKTNVSKWNKERPEGYFDLIDEDLRNEDLWNADLRNADLSDADLRNANLSDADLRNANLSDADLRNADLSDADLRNANLSDANLRNANLRNANLSDANLSDADLSDANLSDANLRNADLIDADLRNANLSDADLRNANLSDANLPSPTILFLACWGEVSNELTLSLMRYDAEHHQDPEAFDKWAAEGLCPYNDTKYQRAVNFREKRDLWKPGRAPRGFELMAACIKEKCKDSDYHE
ncbi:MAG: pentapeptide repeat-containing protein [bacterium]|nr:pentapeptide repeat-containing protein [bacterium]